MEDGLALVLADDSGNSLVGSQSDIFARNVLLRNTDIEAEIERGAQFRCWGFAFFVRHCALEHLAIEIEADGGDVSMLFAAQEIARTTQLEVERRDAETCAQFTKLAQGRERGAAPGA